MIVRLRFSDGSTSRVSVEKDDTCSALLRQISSLNKVTPEYTLSTDPNGSQCLSMPDVSALLSSTGIKHGDMLYVNGDMIQKEQEQDHTNTRVTAMEQDGGSSKREAQPQQQEEGFYTKTGRYGRCLHGPKGMCERCMPKEDKRERYKKELEKWDGKGMSIAVMEALENMYFKVKAQDVGELTSVSVDYDSGHSFQAYLAKTHFLHQRYGILYGKIDDAKSVEVDAIYEPPQEGNDVVYKAKSAEDSGDISERAEKIAKYLGMVPVGLIFSAKPRKCILSGLDILTAAAMQVEIENRHGLEIAQHFVILVVSLAEDGTTLFEAYQLSDQCIEMYKTNIFLPEEKQKANSGRIKTSEPVIVEGVEVNVVHTEFFLINVPIKDHRTWLSTHFPVENRELEPQSTADVAPALKKSPENATFPQKLRDFHLLLFLSNMLDINNDMKSICEAVKEGREFTDIEEGYKLMIEAMAWS